MIVIEDEGKLKFFDGKKELTLREGFARLDAIYGGEPQETKRVINHLKEKYMKDLTNHQVFLFVLYATASRPCADIDDRPQNEYDFSESLCIIPFRV